MKYLKDLVGDEYRNWDERKVFISAPTGIGKSTFILKTLLPYVVTKRKKMLILCNRKLLREQYWKDIVMLFDDYGVLSSSVDVKTYQEIAMTVREAQSFNEAMFKDYDVICCDECHYFYADSDFNPFGTYALLQAIVYCGIGKQMIFLSATMDEVKPLLHETIKKAVEYNNKKYPKNRCYEHGDILEYRYEYLEDYDRFHCIGVSDMNSLFDRLLESPNKSLVFIDSKDDAEKYAKYCTDKTKEPVVTLYSDNMDKKEKQTLIKKMVNAHKLEPKILITTAVLDNGVSIKDPDVQNVAIITDSKISFLQMLGRIRSGYCEKINLFFVLRDAGIFEKRARQYQEYKIAFEQLQKKEGLGIQSSSIIYTMWYNEGRVAEIYRSVIVPLKKDFLYYDNGLRKARGFYGDTCLALNYFGFQKNADMYLQEEKFAALAQDSSVRVVHEQMRWIGKNPEELEVMGGSTYIESQLEELRDYLLTVGEVDKNALQEIKEKIAREYKPVIPEDIQTRGKSFSSEKLEKILSIMHLQLKKVEKNEKTEEEKATKKTYYSIIEAEAEKKAEVSEGMEEI